MANQLVQSSRSASSLRFYTALRSSSGMLDTSQSALAIHHAVRQYRDGFGRKAGAGAPHPLLWGAYLHAGA